MRERTIASIFPGCERVYANMKNQQLPDHPGIQVHK